MVESFAGKQRREGAKLVRFELGAYPWVALVHSD